MTTRYRVTAFGGSRAPWRDSIEEAVENAIALGLASWDASRRECYLAAPVGRARKAA